MIWIYWLHRITLFKLLLDIFRHFTFLLSSYDYTYFCTIHKYFCSTNLCICIGSDLLKAVHLSEILAFWFSSQFNCFNYIFWHIVILCNKAPKRIINVKTRKYFIFNKTFSFDFTMHIRHCFLGREKCFPMKYANPSLPFFQEEEYSFLFLWLNHPFCFVIKFIAHMNGFDRRASLQ